MSIVSIILKNRLRVGLGTLAVAAVAAGGFVTFGRAQAQNSATAQLNTDLIRAKADLEGWQMETNRGDLAAADYRAAFSSDLNSMSGMLHDDSAALPQ